MSVAVRCVNGKCSNESDVWLADATTKKGWHYQSLCCGSFDNKAYNFKSDPFALLGREAATLETSTQPCAASCMCYFFLFLFFLLFLPFVFPISYSYYLIDDFTPVIFVYVDY